MSKHCTTSVKKDGKGFRYQVHCGGEVVACGSRSSSAIAHVAADREKAVYQKVHSGGGRKPAAKKTAKRRAKR